MQCETRYNAFRTLYKENPTLQLGGVTVGWLKQAFQAIDQIQSTSIELPILLMQAERDTIVANTWQDKVVARNKIMQKKCYHGSLHEILFEQDAIRDLALNDIFQFFKTDLCE